MATTVQARTPGVAMTTAGTAKTIAIPTGYAANDFLTLFAASGSGPPNAMTGWNEQFSGNDGSIYWACWTREATAGDISAGTFQVDVPAAGKCGLILLGHYVTGGEVTIATAATLEEAVVDNTHEAPAVVMPGPGTVVSILGLKDTTTSVSAFTAPPAVFPAATRGATAGSSQITVALSSTGTNDVPAGSAGAGNWTITQADGVTAATSSRAIVATLGYTAVRRPSGDISTPAGATFTGGATLTAVAGDDNPSSYMTYSGSGVTWETRIGVGSVVPNFVQVDCASEDGATQTDLHAYLMLGAVQLLDLGAQNSLVPNVAAGGARRVWSLAALTSVQKADILADPTNLRFRCVSTVA